VEFDVLAANHAALNCAHRAASRLPRCPRRDNDGALQSLELSSLKPTLIDLLLGCFGLESNCFVLGRLCATQAAILWEPVWDTIEGASHKAHFLVAGAEGAIAGAASANGSNVAGFAAGKYVLARGRHRTIMAPRTISVGRHRCQLADAPAADRPPAPQIVGLVVSDGGSPLAHRTRG
jgi:hypothetical protein